MNTTETKVHIDNREHSLIEIATTANFHVTVAPLPVADIVVSRGGVCVLIERKTIDDLISSIKDGRYNEQKSRLLNERDVLGSKIVYIIEGTKASVLAESAILSMILRDQIHVIRTRNVNDTFTCVVGIYNKMAKDTFYSEVSVEASLPNEKEKERPPVIFSEKAPRKTGITPQTCYISMLIQIPGISQKTALSIAGRYPCMADLLIADACGLSSLKVSDNRKLGDKKAAVVAKYLNFVLK